MERHDGGAAAVIDVRGLARTYRRGRVRAVRDVSFRVAPGEVFGLIGPDGAGKTSVLQILAGVLRPDAGEAHVAGVDVRRDPEAVKSRIGYMPQGLGLSLYDTLTVEENIAFFRDLRRVPADRYRDNRDRLLRMTHLGGVLDRPARALSGGMRQKLGLVCALIDLPRVLLLDEPTTGVDPISRREFWTIIHTLVAGGGVTVLLTTSYMDEAERCHTVSLMHQGALIAQGPPAALVAALPGGGPGTLEDVFVHLLTGGRTRAVAPVAIPRAPVAGLAAAPAPGAAVVADRLTVASGPSPRWTP